MLAAVSTTSGCITSHRFPAAHGIVLEGETQTPIADATVLASYTTGGLLFLGVADGCKTYHVAKTDSDGRFKVPATTAWNFFIPPLLALSVGAREFAVYKNGYQPSRAASYAETDEVLLLLTPTTDVERQRHGFGFCPQPGFIPRTN
jgi:hypothetical protein